MYIRTFDPTIHHIFYNSYCHVTINSGKLYNLFPRQIRFYKALFIFGAFIKYYILVFMENGKYLIMTLDEYHRQSRLPWNGKLCIIRLGLSSVRMIKMFKRMMGILSTSRAPRFSSSTNCRQDKNVKKEIYLFVILIVLIPLPSSYYFGFISIKLN